MALVNNPDYYHPFDSAMDMQRRVYDAQRQAYERDKLRQMEDAAMQMYRTAQPAQKPIPPEPNKVLLLLGDDE